MPEYLSYFFAAALYFGVPWIFSDELSRLTDNYLLKIIYCWLFLFCLGVIFVIQIVVFGFLVGLTNG